MGLWPAGWTPGGSCLGLHLRAPECLKPGDRVRSMSGFADPAPTLPQEDKMAEEQVDMEYISLHGHIRNTPSDTEVHAEHQLRTDRNT